MRDLLSELPVRRGREPIGDGAVVLRGFAVPRAGEMLAAVAAIASAAPFRHLTTPGGHVMSVAMTNCGDLGWVSDRAGYRYQRIDPGTGEPWPAMPDVLASAASDAADTAGYVGFVSDACLINRYEPDARLSLHQDRNERDFAQPIVSMSFGVSAVFLFGGARRSDRPRRIRLDHGDVVVWGGATRLFFHGVEALDDEIHPITGRCRINLTFRRAGS